MSILLQLLVPCLISTLLSRTEAQHSTADATAARSLSFVFGPSTSHVLQETLCAEVAKFITALDSRYDDFHVLEDRNGEVHKSSMPDATQFTEYLCTQAGNGGDSCQPVSADTVSHAVTDSSDGGSVFVFSKSTPQEESSYVQSMLIANKRDVQVTVFLVGECGGDLQLDPPGVLQLLAAHTSRHMYLPASSQADLAPLLEHHLNISSRQRLVPLVATVRGGGTSGSSYYISSAESELFISAVCENELKPQMQMAIRHAPDRARLQVADTSTVYLARLSNPSPRQFSVYVRSRSTCRLLVSALTSSAKPRLRYTTQEHLTAAGVPTQSTIQPQSGGRSFILVPVTSDVDVRRIDIIFPSGRQGRALYSTRSAFTNSSLLVLGPIDFTRHRFRLLVRGQVGDTEMGQLTESIFPARPEPQTVDVTVSNSCDPVQVVCPVAREDRITAWRGAGHHPLAQDSRIQFNRTHLFISQLYPHETLFSCSAVSETEDVEEAVFNIAKQGLSEDGCEPCTRLVCPYADAAWDSPFASASSPDLLLCAVPPERRSGHYTCRDAAAGSSDSKRQTFTVYPAGYFTRGRLNLRLFQDVIDYPPAITTTTGAPEETTDPATTQSLVVTTETQTLAPDQDTTTSTQAPPVETREAELDTTAPVDQPTQPAPGTTVMATESPATTDANQCPPVDYRRSDAVVSRSSPVPGVQVIELRCDDGFSLRGAGRIACVEEAGYWSETLGECISVDVGVPMTTMAAVTMAREEETQPPPPATPGNPSCPPLADPSNGRIRVTDVVREGQSLPHAQLACRPGYVVIGAADAVCLSGANQWSNDIGSCQEEFSPTTAPAVTEPLTTPTPVITTIQTEARTTEPSNGIACPILPDPAGGQILTRTIDNNGQMMGFVELRCDEGYTVIGVSTAVCLPVVNRWNRAIGTCEGVPAITTIPTEAVTTASSNLDACPLLSDRPGGQIVTRTINNNGRLMGFAELRCDDGYTIAGVATAVCLPGVNQWNRGIGMCEGESADDACPMLLDPAGGRILLRTIDNNGQMMGFAELRCDEGYTVIGVSTAVCLPVVNQWNRVLGTCEGVTELTTQAAATTAAAPTTTPPQATTTAQQSSSICTPLASVSNGVISLRPLREGFELARLSCDDGYRATGAQQILCAGGTWRGQIGTCQPVVRLATDPAITTAPATVVPLTTVPPTTVPATTEARTRPCAQGPSVDNGLVSRQITLDGTIIEHLVCFSRYSPVGNRRRRCHPNVGSWNGNLGSCVQQGATTVSPTTPPATTACPEPSISVANGQITMEILPDGVTRARLVCDAGSVQRGSTRGLVCSTRNPGRWTGALGTCQRLPDPTTAPPATLPPVAPAPQPSGCRSRNTLPNGAVSFTAAGSTLLIATYRCSEGYTMQGQSTAVCFNERWNRPLPQCVGQAPTGCRERSTLTNGKVSFLQARATLLIATYRCDAGYRLEGHATAVCIGVTWNRALPQCVSERPQPPADNCNVDPAVRSARLRVTNIEASLSTARSEKADLQSKLAEARRQLAESTNVAAEMRALRSRYSVLSATHSEDVSKLSACRQKELIIKSAFSQECFAR
ncbi:uncharacterized protein LOC135829972 isoform X2 [Sycon ciliatum]|uniref:uncharacterized protein LOC135829972 isoform X2 n=1 Tax=Sycon ciliatum TaxID=27933 RepID=UPI0031F6F1A4